MMQQQETEIESAMSGLRMGIVVGVAPLRVRVGDTGVTTPLSTLAESATPVGKGVVVARCEGRDVVMGVIGGPSEMTSGLEGGFAVCVRPTGEDASVTITDPHGHALVRFDSASGTLTLSSPVDLNLRAGRALRVFAPRTEIGNNRAHVAVDGDTVNMCAGRLKARVDESDLESDTTTLRGDRASVTLDGLDLAVRQVRLNAERVQSMVRNVYSDVKELAQLQAQRLRVLISGTTHVRADAFNLRTSRNVSVDGDQINLG